MKDENVLGTDWLNVRQFHAKTAGIRIFWQPMQDPCLHCLRAPETAMDKAWKQTERRVAQLLGGSRYWANAGRDIDVESGAFVAQVKHVRVCSLALLERLAREAERQGTQKHKIGLVVVKRRAGKGLPTIPLIVMTEGMFKAMSGPLPGEGTTG
jgi:hypothetical protein